MRTIALVIGVAATALLSGPGAVHAETVIDGLEAPATIVRDSSSIPHVFAANEHDLYFLQGWVHAQDRLFQMDVLRRQASGTLAELLGEAALPSDVEARVLGLRRAAELSWPLLSPDVQAAMTAYAEGVNAYLDNAASPPLEYGLLELSQVAPWQPLDSVAVAKGLAFSLSFELDIDRTIALASYQAAGAIAGFDGTALFFEDLFRSEPFDPASTIPDAKVPYPHLAGGGPAMAVPAINDQIAEEALELGKRYMGRVRGLPLFRGALQPRGDTAGSNQWVISGKHTASGVPLLASDPHLPLGLPATFYQNHLVSPDVDVIGSSLAGTPFVITGHNRHIAWGPTTNDMDVTDTFVEAIVPCGGPFGFCTVHDGVSEPIIPIPVTFKANLLDGGAPDTIVTVPAGGDIPPFVLTVPRRNGGPLIEFDPVTGFGLSVQYVGFSGTREPDAFYAWNHARNLNAFKNGLQFFDVGSQNWVYADTRGKIAYFVGGEMPLREDLQAGIVAGLPPFFLRDGTGGNEWVPLASPQPGQAIPYEILPFGEMPHIVNPPAGFIINANNDPLGLSLDNDPLNDLRKDGGILYFHYGGSYRSFRAARITQLIEELLTTGDGKASFDEMKEMQADTVLVDAQAFVPHIVQAFDNAAADPFLAAFAADPAIAEAIGRLAAWNFSTPTGLGIDGYDAGVDDPAASVAATIYAVWRSRVLANTVDAFVDVAGLPKPEGGETRNALRALRHLLDNFDLNQGVGASGIDFFFLPFPAPAETRRDFLLLQSLKDALDRLASDDFAPAFANSTNQDDYRWGLLHRVVFAHPLTGPFNAPPAGGFLPPAPGLIGVATDGGYQTVDRADNDPRADGVNEFMYDTGASQRMVVELSKAAPSAESSLPGSETGNLLSPDYLNLLEAWLVNDTHGLFLDPDDDPGGTTSEDFVPAP